MEPQIQYARTSDGVSIAYAVAGTGPPLVYLPPMPGHVQMEWQSGVFGELYRSLASRYRLIRLDFRDTGLSQRAGIDTENRTVLDLEAVLDRQGVAQTAIWAQGPAGFAAIRFAAQRPARVDALVLSECVASFGDLAGVGAVQALISLAERDFETFTETMGSVFFGWEAQRPAREYAAILRAGMSSGLALEGMRQLIASDVTDLLPLVQARTLVLHHRDAQLVPTSAATQLASDIPNARLVLLEGDTVAGVQDDPVERGTIDEFLLGEAAPPRAASASFPAGTAIILFADIAGSTALTERIGDVAFRERARSVDAAVRGAVREAGGRPVEGKVMGDGVMSVFNSARQAIDGALRCREISAQQEMPLHLGLHAGDILREGDNVYGGAVNIAARVCDASAPGEIWVTDMVRGLARTSAGVAFEARGEPTLKGIDEPQRLWAVVG